jgi:heme exporter protein C
VATVSARPLKRGTRGGLPLPFQVLGVATAVALLAAMAMALLYAPTERVQGDVQRIFYFHVPAAWVAYLAFAVVLVGSIAYLWRRELRWDMLAQASAEIGVVFTTLALVTGSIWGRAVWGTWWTWDARLTTTLILWFIYAGYLMLRAYIPERARAARSCAVLGIVGFIDVPIVHMSVQWWRTLHPQPVVVRAGEAPALPPTMMTTLLVALLAFTLLYALLLVLRLWAEGLREDVAALRAAAGEV